MDEYKIESGVKVPKKWGRWTGLAADMKEGNSIVVKFRNEAAALSAAIRGRKYPSAIRKVKDGFRVWLLDKESEDLDH